MFYLVQFFRLIKEWPVRGVSYLLMSFFLVMIAARFTQVRSFMNGFWNDPIESSYFYALCPESENVARISRKIKTLPGVKLVSLVSQAELNKRLGQVIDEVGLSDQVSELASLSYIGIKVTFDHALSIQSMNLVRDYLTRLVGEDKVVLGRIYEAQSKQQKSNLKVWSAHILLTIVLVLWGFICSFFNLKIMQKGHLLEQFQRRKFVAFKLFVFGNAVLCLFGFILSLIFSEVNYLALLSVITLIMITSVYNLKKYTWS